jgi:hypothetical protein
MFEEILGPGEKSWWEIKIEKNEEMLVAFLCEIKLKEGRKY